MAAYITDWPLPDELGPVHSQIIARIDQKIIKPAWLDEQSAHLWAAFVRLRQQRALYFFEKAKNDIQKQKQMSARDGIKTSNEAMRLLIRALRENPEHAMSRRALGYVRHGDQWVWPNVARQLAQKKEYSPEEGWLRNGKNFFKSSSQDFSINAGGSRTHRRSTLPHSCVNQIIGTSSRLPSFHMQPILQSGSNALALSGDKFFLVLC